MKILYYNWTQFDKRINEGGGVSVYQKNLIDYLVNKTDNEIYFLSSGTCYNVMKQNTYIEETHNTFGNKCRTFQIVNSKCVAPGKAISKDIDTYLEDESCYEILKQFLEEYGKFDIIHFNNIEGLSCKCLQIKKDFPNIKVIYSIHNYFLFCPQVNLFYKNTQNCTEFENGTKCYNCIRNNPSAKMCKFYYRIAGVLEKLHIDRFCIMVKDMGKRLKGRRQDENEIVEDTRVKCKTYNDFRNENVNNINKYVDIVLAVSDRVRKIAINMGIKEAKIYTSYIGTAFAENSINALSAKLNDKYITIAYMGYLNKLKGASFLIDALEALPKDIAKKIKFVCYARKNDEEGKRLVSRIEMLKDKLLQVEYHDGYRHEDLKEILKEVNLGVVPVIWEDNLPQVAIEYIANGVPVLCSNLGGAQELCPMNDFIFEANNKRDFINKLTNILNNKELLRMYFDNNIKLTTMEQHMEELLKYYETETLENQNK